MIRRLILLLGPLLRAAEKPPAFTRVKPGATLQSPAVSEGARSPLVTYRRAP